MDRRTFLAAASSVVISDLILFNSAQVQAQSTIPVKPFELGLMIYPTYNAPEASIKRLHDIGFATCFLSLDGYINRFTPQAAADPSALLRPEA